MKRTFLPRHSLFVSPAGLSWGGIILIIAILALVMRVLAPNLFWTITAPLTRSASAVSGGTHFFLSCFYEAARLTQDNERLTRDNEALQIENATLRAQAREVGALGAAEGGIVAGVVARPPVSPYDTLVVAAGTRGGVSEGMRAYGAGGMPLGRVEQASADFSRIILYSAPEVETQGWVGVSTPITLRGAGGGAFTATLARTAQVAVGDAVYVPGPGMVALGVVARIDDDPSAASMVLRIIPAINPLTAGWVRLRAAAPSSDVTAPLRAASSTAP
jgi:hypothetical protein